MSVPGLNCFSTSQDRHEKGCKPSNPCIGYFQYIYFLTKTIGFKQIMSNTALLGVGLGLGFELQNKERSKEDQRHYQALDGKT